MQVFVRKQSVAGLLSGKPTAAACGAPSLRTTGICSFSSQVVNRFNRAPRAHIFIATVCVCALLQPTNGGAGEFRGASEQKLAEIGNKLADEIPAVFFRSLDYSFTHNNVVLENRFKGKTYVWVENSLRAGQILIFFFSIILLGSIFF